MVTWKEFAAAAPDMADIGRSLLLQFKVGLAFLATVRKDGAPRLHPVCPVLSNDRLFVLIVPTSPKRQDLVRDGRYALQTFPQPKPGSDEFYISGKAVAVDDQAARADILRDAEHMADASETVFELWIDRVMHTRWEHVLTPQMRPQHRKWRAPADPAAPSFPHRQPADWLVERDPCREPTVNDASTAIRPFEDRDEAAVVAVWHRSGRAAYQFLPTWQALTLERARRVFREVIRPRCSIWVGTRHEDVVAFLAMADSYVDRMYVDPTEWRKGWGTRLVLLAKTLHPNGLELHTHQENHAARQLCERHGFRAVKFGFSAPPESAPDVEYHWRPADLG